MLVFTNDDLGRLVGIDHKNAAGTSVGTYAYTFDAGDRLTGETFNGASKTYAYDKLGQLTSDNGTVYTYDASGNRTGGGYATTTGNRTTSDGTWTYTYDDAGQLTGKSKSGEAWAYTYDFRGQMTSASKSATPGGTVTDSVSYKLDAWGNRIGRDQSGSTASTQRYVVDGWDPAKAGAVGTENFDAVMDLDGSNAVTSRRLFGGGFDSVAARQDAGGGVTWYGADGLGSVRQVFDNSGNTTGSQAFTGFGAVTATSGTGQDRYAYSGTATDPLTGLVGDDARQYDPTLGRWTSDDPIGFGGGDYNVGRYAGNSPTNAIDPSGLADVDQVHRVWNRGVGQLAKFVFGPQKNPTGRVVVNTTAGAVALAGDVVIELGDITANALAQMGKDVGKFIDDQIDPKAKQEAAGAVVRTVEEVKSADAELREGIVKFEKEEAERQAGKPANPNRRDVCVGDTGEELDDAIRQWAKDPFNVRLLAGPPGAQYQVWPPSPVMLHDFIVGMPGAIAAVIAAENAIPDRYPDWKPPKNWENLPLVGPLWQSLYHWKNGRPIHAAYEGAMFLFDLASVVEAGVALGKFVASSLTSPLVRLVGKDMAAALNRQMVALVEREGQAVMRGAATKEGQTVLRGSATLRTGTKSTGCAVPVTRMSAGHFPNGASDNFARLAGQIPKLEGYFDLYVHSMNRGTSLAQLGVDGTKEVADMLAIEKTLIAAGWDRKQPIRLVSCRAADPALGKRAVAEQMAEFFGVKVLAPTEDISLFENGVYVITNKIEVEATTKSTGVWRLVGK